MSKGFQSGTMRQIYGAVEFWSEGQWLEVVDIASLLAQHIGLNGCLFGVDNHAGYAPLFADRGLPGDCSATLRTRAERFTAHDRRASWALWSELAGVDWEVRADDRHGPGAPGPEDGADASDAVIDKWLHDRRWVWARDALDRDPDLFGQSGIRVFRRFVPKRSDCLVNTEFPLVMKLMRCLAERFGDQAVRLVVWFGSPGARAIAAAAVTA